MITMQNPEIINLAEFGGEGYVEIMYPAFSKKRKASNLASSMLIKIDRNGTPVKDTSKQLDAALVVQLAFIESAPFEPTFEGFMEFTDSLDAKERGMGEKFYTAFVEAVEKVKHGVTSPSPGSQAAENVSSE